MYYWKLETCKYKNSDPAGSYLGSGSTPDPEMLDPAGSGSAPDPLNPPDIQPDPVHP